MGASTSDKGLIEKRSRDMLSKFNELYHQKRYRYDYVLWRMKWENFFINEKNIHNQLRKMGAEIPNKYSVKNSTTDNGLTLLEARNNALKARFQKLYEEKKMRVDDAVNILSGEFYIHPSTVNNVLNDYSHYKNARGQLELFD